MKVRVICAAVACLTLATPALAATFCTAAAQDTWLPQVEMLQRLVDAGYTIERFEITDGGCYHFQGYDKAGKPLEIDFSPVDGHVVKMRSA